MFSTIINPDGLIWHGFLLDNSHSDYFIFAVKDEGVKKIWECDRGFWSLII